MGPLILQRKDEYPKLAARFEDAERRRIAKRWLRVNFSGDNKLISKEILETAQEGALDRGLSQKMV